MADRLNTIVCGFDPTSPRMSALDIHEWIYEKVRIPESGVRLIQIDGPRRQVYIKLNSTDYAKEIVRDSAGQLTYTHETGEISIVRIDFAGMGTRKIRIADLPPEVSDQAISRALQPYGEILELRHETWSSIYRYKVPNGIRIALTTLKKHVPSRMSIGGHRATISYGGQPPTCFGCNGIDHQYQQCPNRKLREPQTAQTQNTWANIVQQKPPTPKRTTDTQEKKDESTDHYTTRQEPHGPTRQETTGKQQDKTETETPDETASKKLGLVERQEHERPMHATTDTRNVNLNWADDLENVESMDITTQPNGAKIVEENIDEAVGPEMAGKESVVREDIRKLADHIQTDEVMLQPLTQTSPKRSKMLKTEREIPYHKNRTRSKTRAVQSPTNAPS